MAPWITVELRRRFGRMHFFPSSGLNSRPRKEIEIILRASYPSSPKIEARRSLLDLGSFLADCTKSSQKCTLHRHHCDGLRSNTLLPRYREQLLSARWEKGSLFALRIIRNTNNIYRNSVRTSQETHYVSATELNRLMLFRETVAVICENQTEHTDTVRTSQ
jgi:hypothetical protein